MLNVHFSSNIDKKINFIQNNYEEIKFEESKLMQDNQALKYDRDNLTKQLEEYDIYIRNYKEKV